MNNFRIILILLSIAGCTTSQLSFEQALEKADSQESELLAKVRDNKEFIQCLENKYDVVEDECSLKHTSSSHYTVVLEFTQSGKVNNVYLDKPEGFQKCIRAGLIGHSCLNPPLKNLFARIKVVSIE